MLARIPRNILFKTVIPLMVKWEGSKWEGKIQGLDAKLYRHPRGSHWIGVVQIPPYHKFYRKSLFTCLKTPQCLPKKIGINIEGKENKVWACKHRIQDIMMEKIHGGPSFAGALKGESGWWIGFDCGHYDDLSPVSLESLRILHQGTTGSYRSKRFAMKELEKLAAAVIKEGANA